MLWIAADIGAGPLWVSECRNKSRTQNCWKKKVRVGMSAARPVILTGVNEAQDVIAL
jgi:hypothetical protein